MSDILIKRFVLFCIEQRKEKSIPRAKDLQPEKYIILESVPQDQIYNREINDIGTNIIVKQFVNSNDKIFNFISIICLLFEDCINSYCIIKGFKISINNFLGDIYIIHKGGNIMRFVFNEAKKNIPISGLKIIEKEFSKYFKKSDSDFSIIINPELENFEEVYDDIMYINYFLQLIIRKIININPQDIGFNIFSYFEFNEDKKKLILKDMLKSLNNSFSVSNPENKDFYKVKFKGIMLYDTLYKEDLESIKIDFNPGKYDFVIDRIDEKFVALIPLTLNKTSIPISVNWNINFTTGTKEKKNNIFFGLVRTKINFKSVLIKDGELRKKNIGGEVIDCTVIHKKNTTNDTIKKFNEGKKFIKRYKLINDDYKLYFYGYNVDGMIHDLEFIFFISDVKPWKNEKYIKRLYRLCFLYIIDLINKTSTSESISIIKSFRLNIIEFYKKKISNNDFSNLNIEQLFDSYYLISNFISYIENLAKISFDDKDKFLIFLEQLDKISLHLLKIFYEIDLFIKTKGKSKEVYTGSLESMAGGKKKIN